jgi:glycosyltransferase involved in cell wall biosynthesis
MATSSKKRILWISNAIWLKTGLSRNTKALFKEWYKSGKYEIIHLCQGVVEGDPKLDMYPWKSVGALSANHQEQQRYQQDPHYARIASYGATKVEEVIKDEKPFAVVLSDDLWAMPLDYYVNKEWSKGTNLIGQITFDSLELLPESFELGKGCHVYSWAPFGEEALKEGLEKRKEETKYNIGTIPAAIETDMYKPVSALEKMNLRKKFGIPQEDILVNFVGRNQLRKKYDTLFKAIASYKKQYPSGPRVRAAIHTSWTEGWPLKRMMESYGLEEDDVLTTYVCKACKEFEIKPYKGEGQDCKFCGSQKSQDSASITNGVSDEEMRLVYAVSDCSLSVYTSGGFEYHVAESLYNSLPTATVGYSCGSTYLDCPAVTELSYVETTEHNSAFTKAEPSVRDCTRFIKKIVDMPESKRRELGRKGREWAIEKFDSKVVAKQWMDIFDGLPEPDYSKIKFGDTKNPNPNFTPDFSLNGQEFVKHLYSGYLDAQYPDEQGLNHWMQRLEQNNEPKEQIASIFQQIAAKDAQPKSIDIKDLLLKNDKKNLFFVLKESLGDCIISLSLLEGARLSYPNHNINIVTEPKFFEVFKGCEFADNLIPYNPILEQEMYIIGAGQEESIGDVFVMPAVATQKHLNYLSNNNPELLKNQWRTDGESFSKLEHDWTLQTK